MIQANIAMFGITNINKDASLSRLEEKKKKFIQDHLEKQIDQFVDGLEKYNQKRPPEKRIAKANYSYLRDFYKQLTIDRNARSFEVSSSSYKKTVKYANAQFPLPTLLVLCIDGRVLPVFLCGAAANIGDSLRVPGADLKEFVRGEDGKIKLIENTNFANLLTNAFNWTKSDTIVEVFDSHVGCAAVQAEEASRGRNPTDGGLLHDVLHKKEMAQAAKNFVTDKLDKKKKVIVIQISFNPSSGFLYMGLETDGALKAAVEQAKKFGIQHDLLWNQGIYTPEVLELLAKEKKILSTKELADEFQVIFEKYQFSPDWVKAYTATAARFWNAIALMKRKLLSPLEKKLRILYSDMDKKDLETRALILLTSAFSGYLLNRISHTNATHKEEGIIVSEAEYSPYKISTFFVLNSDEKNLVANIDLASTLVRKNRVNKRVQDKSGIFSDVQNFSRAPIAIMVKEPIRGDIPFDEWKKIMQIDWSDMPHNWNTMSNIEFLSYLESKNTLPIAVALGINNLRKRMALLFDPTASTSAHLIAHHKIVLPVVMGEDKIIYSLIPFVKHGF